VPRIAPKVDWAGSLPVASASKQTRKSREPAERNEQTGEEITRMIVPFKKIDSWGRSLSISGWFLFKCIVYWRALIAFFEDFFRGFFTL
jgi:hypothetical protein